MKLSENPSIQAALIVVVGALLGFLGKALLLGQATIQQKLDSIHREQATKAEQTKVANALEIVTNGHSPRQPDTKTRADDAPQAEN